MIVIDKDKCNGCGLCARICHEHCITLSDNLPEINYEVCSTCTQCVAICSCQALTWDYQEPVAYDKTKLPSPDQLEELYQERRSIRFFRKDKIERDQLEEIKAKVENVVKRGHAFSSWPAAMVFIVGEKRIPLSYDSAQYALANMIYYAQTQGIGSCLCGNGPLVFDRSKEIRNRLKLQSREHIQGALFLGYPAIKFTNKVRGKVLPVQWNSDSENLKSVSDMTRE